MVRWRRIVADAGSTSSNTAAMLNCGSPGWRVLGQAVLVYLAIASSAATAEDSQPGRGTLAEMVAFARLGSVACQRLAPDVEGFHALSAPEAYQTTTHGQRDCRKRKGG